MKYVDMLRDSGLQVFLVGDKVRIIPASKLDDSTRTSIQQNRQQIVAELLDEKGPRMIPCEDCGCELTLSPFGSTTCPAEQRWYYVECECGCWRYIREEDYQKWWAHYEEIRLRRMRASTDES